MPLYEFKCAQCGHRFERIQKFSDPPPAECPECKGQVEQLMSAPAVQFKGSGWYVTDYARKSGGTAKEGASGNGTGAKDTSSDSSKATDSQATAKKGDK